MNHHDRLTVTDHGICNCSASDHRGKRLQPNRPSSRRFRGSVTDVTDLSALSTLHARTHEGNGRSTDTIGYRLQLDLVPMPRFQTWGGLAERGFAFALCGHGGAPC